MIDHPVVVGVGVRAGVAQYPRYHHSHHAVHAHIHVPSIDLVPARDHDQDRKDGMNPIHGLIQNMKHTSAPSRNRIRRGWRSVVEWLRSETILTKNPNQCDHGVRTIKNYYLLHHLRLFGWMKILRIT
jgi:hypothetical protein